MINQHTLHVIAWANKHDTTNLPDLSKKGYYSQWVILHHILANEDAVSCSLVSHNTSSLMIMYGRVFKTPSYRHAYLMFLMTLQMILHSNGLWCFRNQRAETTKRAETTPTHHTETTDVKAVLRKQTARDFFARSAFPSCHNSSYNSTAEDMLSSSRNARCERNHGYLFCMISKSGMIDSLTISATATRSC